MKTILIMLPEDRVSDENLEEIQTIAPDKKRLLTLDEDVVIRNAEDIEIAAGWVPRELLPKMPNLCWFQQWGAGADWLMKNPEVIHKDFILTNMSGLHAIPISEHIFAFLLAFARDLHRAVKAQNVGKWLKHENTDVFELAGSTMVLLGVGAIGERTAEIAQRFGMRVLGVRKNPGMLVPFVEKMFGPSQLMEVLPQGDFIVLTIPLTPETKGMIGELELKTMKSSAYLINIGRGGTIQEEYLVKALREGWIAGAGLDVFVTEPLPSDSPLWEMENVIITSHYSGLTPHYSERGFSIFIDNLKRYQAGKPLKNVVDKSLAY